MLNYDMIKQRDIHSVWVWICAPNKADEMMWVWYLLFSLEYLVFTEI